MDSQACRGTGSCWSAAAPLSLIVLLPVFGVLNLPCCFLGMPSHLRAACQSRALSDPQICPWGIDAISGKWPAGMPLRHCVANLDLSLVSLQRARRHTSTKPRLPVNTARVSPPLPATDQLQHICSASSMVASAVLARSPADTSTLQHNVRAHVGF